MPSFVQFTPFSIFWINGHFYANIYELVASNENVHKEKELGCEFNDFRRNFF